jgi:hypothetical protein
VNVGTSVLTALPIGANGGICNGGANDGEICDPDAPICPGECLAFVGPDEEPCTMDDLIPRGTQGTIPSTTGTASASLFGALSDEGGCTGPLSGTCVSNACSGGWNDGAPCTPGALDPCRLPCIEDANCEGTGTCTNPDPVLRTQATSFSGSPIDCTGYESSDLAGLVLVNAFPIPDTSSFGDGVTTNVLVCD